MPVKRNVLLSNLLVITAAVATLLFIMLFPLAYVRERTGEPGLQLFNADYGPPPPPPPTPHTGVDFVPHNNPVWGFYQDGSTFLEVEYVNDIFELWYAGSFCLMLAVECRFTPPFDLNSGEYSNFRGLYKIFVLEQNANRFKEVWQPINLLRH